MGTAADPGVLPRALDVIFNSIEKGRMCELSMKPKYFSEVRTLSSSDQAKEQEAKEKLMAQVSDVCVCVCGGGGALVCNSVAIGQA